MRRSEMSAAAGGEEERPRRRVGTFTLGVTLVLAGSCMMASLFCPDLDFTWALKCSPGILVALGVETLLSTRRNGRVKYDWVGMLLCFLLTGAALCMTGAAWWICNAPCPPCRDALPPDTVFDSAAQPPAPLEERAARP